jgi:hypothetical protein
MFQTEFAKKIKTHFMCKFFNSAVYEIRNVEKYCRAGQTADDNIIASMRFACWITNDTDIHSEYVILIASPLQYLLHEGSSMVRYTQITWPVTSYRPDKYVKKVNVK